MTPIVIVLGSLREPIKISDIMKAADCRQYTYGFYLNGSDALKYGKSDDTEWQHGTFGDRIYRQASGLPGWADGPFDSTGAKEMRAYLKRFPHLNWVTKDDVSIIVHDYTKDFEAAGITADASIEARLLNEEYKLVKSYVQVHGSQPIFNKQQTKGHYDAAVGFNNFFDVVEPV